MRIVLKKERDYVDKCKEIKRNSAYEELAQSVNNVKERLVRRTNKDFVFICTSSS
jgi:hypothetical protein